MRKLLSIIFILTVAFMAVSALSCEAAKKVVAVMPIESPYDETARKVAEIMETQLTRALHDSSNYTVVERNQLSTAMKEIGFQMTGAVDPNKTIQVGKMLGVQYSVISKVSVAELANNKDKIILGTLLGLGMGGGTTPNMDKFVAKIAVDIKFIDNETGEIVLMTQVKGEKGGESEESVLNEACKIAADDFLTQIQKKNPFTAMVLEAYGEEIYIDAGSNAGLHEGDILELFKEDAPIKNMEGKIIAVRSTTLGRIQVKTVYDEYSICQVISRSSYDTIARGISVRRV
ncbi:MAG: hypothetical protein IJ862_04390 [Selenomonadaceae bacterium]|nr:hypothetical protein [Selenomonadaceae bacterium]